MGSFATQALGRQVLDWLLRSERYVQCALFTVPPTEAGDDGTEVTGGGYVRADVTTPTAAAGQSGARTAQALTSSLLFPNMPVGSEQVAGIALTDGDTGEVLLVNDTWTPTQPFEVGGDLLIDAAEIYTAKL